MTFTNIQSAFEFYYDKILSEGVERNGTKALFNVGFTILNPLDNEIKTPWRKWKKDYADLEWAWYLSGNQNAMEIAKHAKIWYKMMDHEGNVNSNYGYQWKRNKQLEKIVDKLVQSPSTRQASISIYDGKELQKYAQDTPCTYAINFSIIDNKLNMSVMMRSNDLVYGFSGVDAYAFSKLQELVRDMLKEKGLEVEVGTYYHFACDLHIYERHWNLKEKNS